jgi:carbon-monoxide dehydrogenase medium subunit
MRPYDYHPATSPSEALDLLGRYGDDAHLMAGGTSLMLLMQQGLVQPGHVVGLRGVKELEGVQSTPDGGLEIRAVTTHRRVERSPQVAAYCPTLAETFSRVATIRIRNQATIGGNLVHADPAQDPPPMLLALDASAVVSSGKGERTVPLDGFFRDIFETAVEEGELLTSVRLPPLASGTRSIYIKFLPRTEDDYATVSVAATLRLGPGNRCEDVRVALGAAAPVPLRAKKVEAAVRGQTLTPQLIAEAAELVRDEVDPIDDVRGSAKYKREMARVWTGRALQELLDGGDGRRWRRNPDF